MNSRSLPVAAATAALIFLSITLLSAGAGIVEHTFVVSMLLALSWILVVPTIFPVLNLEFETRSAGEPGAYDSHVQ
jgi:hypothetical protein